MKSKHLIMGTAGHVDHGKTTLIKALTGFDCDTHKQEKERGITINLGFSHLDLPDGNSVGIVDVPGHADFIKTMVAGACGIDFVLLIIAADEGIMPQTIEHLQIMRLLGIDQGIIVLTKVDLIESDLFELAREEVKDLVQNTFLEDASIIPVSSVNNTGLDELKKEIGLIVSSIPDKSETGIFRMFVDRIFSLEGFGTIMNGSVLSGKICKSDPVFLLPGSKELRIRRLEHHGRETDFVRAGDRASLNLVGFRQKDFRKGMVLADREVVPTRMIDAQIFLFQKEVSLKLWNQVVFLLGTNRLICRLHLLDKNELKTEDNGLVQIYLPTEIICQTGDKFIIRDTSDHFTLGGGRVVDPYPLHHRRRREKQIELLKKRTSGTLSDMIVAEVNKTIFPLSYKEIAATFNMNANDLIETIFNELPEQIEFYQFKEDIILLQKSLAVKIKNKILSNLQLYHRENPLREYGRSFKELMGIFGNQQNDSNRQLLQIALEMLIEQGKVNITNNSYVLASHKVDIDPETRKQIAQLDEFFVHLGENSADLTEIKAKTGTSMPDKKLLQLLKAMQDEKKLYYIQRNYFHHQFITKAKNVIIEYIRHNPEGITVAAARDLIGSNRANTLMILELMDNESITLRKGNFRILTRKFLENSQQKDK
jgi:selenocysteine-specific elongation factor